MNGNQWWWKFNIYVPLMPLICILTFICLLLCGCADHADQVFSISEGRTLLIPCESDRKQVWSFKKEKSSRRVTIFTLFKNGTIIRERDDPQGRFVLHRRALEIVRLELEDSGRYMCNSNLVAKVTVIKGEDLLRNFFFVSPLFQEEHASLAVEQIANEA